jgi:hypothetical protein
MTKDMIRLSPSQLDLSSFMICHRVCYKSNMTGGTSGAGIDYHLGIPDFTPSF